ARLGLSPRCRVAAFPELRGRFCQKHLTCPAVVVASAVSAVLWELPPPPSPGWQRDCENSVKGNSHSAASSLARAPRVNENNGLPKGRLKGSLYPNSIVFPVFKFHNCSVKFLKKTTDYLHRAYCDLILSEIAGSSILSNHLKVLFLSFLGVCFRMYTEEEARKLGVVGWVKNTSQGTVTGQVQGPEDKVNAMKSWLSKVGSPSSRIDRTNFSNEKEIPKLDFTGFSTRY
uniref:acylphosphatase n=1 Tax=Athene cunicularia TaxID=194338 RepID=A0A663N0T8_ATHCN